MLRDEWEFNYKIETIAEATTNKLQFHQERLKWWKEKKEQVMAKIREDGLEIDENIVMEYLSPKSRDWERGAQVTVRDDLKKDLDECLKKLAYHTAFIDDFNGWNQLLVGNPNATLGLDHSDWLFFFGHDNQSRHHYD